MIIYLAMVDCHDYLENGGGEYALDKAFLSKDEALTYAQKVAKEWIEYKEEEKDYYEGFTKEIELKGIKYLVLPERG